MFINSKAILLLSTLLISIYADDGVSRKVKREILLCDSISNYPKDHKLPGPKKQFQSKIT